MKISTTSEVEKLIDKNEINNLKESINSDLMGQIIYDDRYDLVENIYDYYHDELDIEQFIFSGILKSSSIGPSHTSVKCFNNFILSVEKLYSYEDDDDSIFYMCQISDNVDLIKSLLEIQTDIPWDYVLYNCCSYLAIDSVKYLIEHFNFKDIDIEKGFGEVINTSLNNCYHESPEQAELIQYFLINIKLSVNSKTDSEWESAYLDCFLNAPNLAKKFYTNDFEVENLNSSDFWEELLEGIQGDDEYKDNFLLAFSDLKSSKIDLTQLIEIFENLGYKHLAKELLI